jgi:hypothetical protein
VLAGRLAYLSEPAAGAGAGAEASLARLRWLPSLFTVHQTNKRWRCVLVLPCVWRSRSRYLPVPVPGEETSRGAASILVIALSLPHVTRTPLSLSRFGFVLHSIVGRAIFLSHGFFLLVSSSTERTMQRSGP